MKIIRKEDGKEVKGTVHHNIMGAPSAVTIDGTRYNASAFEFKDEKAVKKTKTTSAKKTKKQSRKK